MSHFTRQHLFTQHFILNLFWTCIDDKTSWQQRIPLGHLFIETHYTHEERRKVFHKDACARALGVASRHRNLRQLRRLHSTVTSGLSVGLRSPSRLIYLITRYIIHRDSGRSLTHTRRSQRARCGKSRFCASSPCAGGGSACLCFWGIGTMSCLHARQDEGRRTKNRCSRELDPPVVAWSSSPPSDRWLLAMNLLLFMLRFVKQPRRLLPSTRLLLKSTRLSILFSFIELS